MSKRKDITLGFEETLLLKVKFKNDDGTDADLNEHYMRFVFKAAAGYELSEIVLEQRGDGYLTLQKNNPASLQDSWPIGTYTYHIQDEHNATGEIYRVLHGTIKVVA